MTIHALINNVLSKISPGKPCQTISGKCAIASSLLRENLIEKLTREKVSDQLFSVLGLKISKRRFISLVGLGRSLMTCLWVHNGWMLVATQSTYNCKINPLLNVITSRQFESWLHLLSLPSSAMWISIGTGFVKKPWRTTLSWDEWQSLVFLLTGLSRRYLTSAMKNMWTFLGSSRRFWLNDPTTYSESSRRCVEVLGFRVPDVL